ncbi:unnamed protein product [Sympodiomycopsis kandeliae]
MKISPLTVTATALVMATVALGQNSDAVGPIGPLTTNNAQSACVEYGDCTALPAGATAVTRTQYSPVTPPPSTVRTAAPTDAAGSAQSISALASQGAGQAYSSRLANGEGSGNPVGDTNISLTAPVSAVSSSAPSASKTSSGGSNGADSMMSGPGHLLSFTGAVMAIAAGAIML